MKVVVLVLMTCLMAGLAPVQAIASDPDLGQLRSQIAQMLASSGPGGYPGDRSELHRRTESGWHVTLLTIWDGENWQLLAARLNHRDRVSADGETWRQRFGELLANLDRDALAERPLPELVEIPPPAFLPALPGEQRGRSFELEGYWYAARWVNTGGLDTNAEWTLSRYELVALP
jgi:hypothetical protein